MGHPVNAFKLMKRLNTEWGELESLVLKDMSDGECVCVPAAKTSITASLQLLGCCLSRVRA